MATVHIMEPVSSHVALLHRISNIVSSELSLDEMLGEIVGLTVQVTDCDACLVYLLDRDTDEVVLRASQVPHAAALGHLRMKVGEGVTGWVAEHKSVVALSSKAGADARFKRFQTLVEDTYEAFLSVPLVSGGDVIGVINVHHRQTHNHNGEEISLLTFIGEQMGGAIAKSILSRNQRPPLGRDPRDEAPARDTETGGARQRHLAKPAQPHGGRGLLAPSQREPAPSSSDEGIG